MLIERTFLHLFVNEKKFYDEYKYYSFCGMNIITRTAGRISNEKFQQLSYKDLRNRRLSESTLRGWILDRSGKLENALALYRRDPSGNIYRDYPMDKAMSAIASLP